jgi:Beta-propeller repeat
VTKLNAAGAGLVYSTFVGGTKSDFGDDFALDAAGNTYLVGGTLSPDFPTTPGTFDPGFGGGSEAFVVKLNPTGSALVYSTFLGNAGASAVAPDANGNAWLAGASGSAGATTADAFDRFFNGGNVDAYVAKLDANGSTLQFASFLGGSESDAGADVALDPAGNNVYVTGRTYSADFTTTPGVFDRTFGGDLMVFWGEGFVARVDLNGTAPPQEPPAPPPAAPALVTPAAGAVVTPPVTFDWGDVPGAVSYTIQVDEIWEFGAPLILSQSVGASQFTTSALPDGNWNWFWRVRAVNAEGTPGAWSEVRTITVQSTPPPSGPLSAPSLVSPASDARFSSGQSVAFDWGDVAGAATYTIQVDDSQSFSSPRVADRTLAFSQVTLSGLPSRRMWWRVRANDGAGAPGAWSAARRFEVRN